MSPRSHLFIRSRTMSLIVVINPKGGAGKSTLSTNIAGYFAAQGHAVRLGDADPQQSSSLWLSLRPASANPITHWPVEPDALTKPPKGPGHVVLDTPAGLSGRALKDVLKMADKVVVPLQASIFDMYATRGFLDTLAQSRHAERLDVGIVGMRVDERTLAADQFNAFVASLDLPLAGTLRDTQNYVHLAVNGLSLFDVAPSRMERDLTQWAPICEWLLPTV
jgi:chromosome partitioning protein